MRRTSVAAVGLLLAVGKAQSPIPHVPSSRVRAATEVQAVMQEGELLLEYTVSDNAALLYVLAPRGDAEAFPLLTFEAKLRSLVVAMPRRPADAQPIVTRGIDRDSGAAAETETVARSRELFEMLVPPAVWPRLRAARRVFVVPSRSLHRVPFELLVTEVRNGTPVYWLDTGPPIAYLPSGQGLRSLRQRTVDAGKGAPEFDVVAIGDPLPAPAALLQREPLPLLPGARAEAEQIAAMVVAKGGKVRVVLEADATETAVFEAAANAKYLHFAGHGIAELHGHVLSALVLREPERVRPEDDGILQLGDLLTRWRGRLSRCRMVVLAANETGVGPVLRDEAPLALPMGFLFAGATSVISSLWAVDDASTRELMTGFYQRLLADETDRLAAFTAAKKAMRARYPDPFHWAPFLYLGIPE